MSIRSILVNVDIDDFSPPFIQAAIELAQKLDASLIGVAAAAPAVAMAGIDGQGAASIYTIELTDIEARLRELEGKYRAMIPAGMTVDWRAWIETPARCLANVASAADLILVHAAPHTPATYLRGVDIGELVLTSGRPVLVVKPQIAPILADKIVIGWKNRREARRAVADALPFLEKASDVLVASVSEGEPAAEQAGLDDVLAWLKRHGVAAHGTLYPAGGEPSSTLLDAARKMSADLIVSGGYGHSRMREWLIGGMTHDLIADATINRLMSN